MSLTYGRSESIACNLKEQSQVDNAFAHCIQMLQQGIRCQVGDPSAGSAVVSSAMQVLTPAVTLAICAMFGLERLTSSLLISIFMITAGTGAATAVEVGVAGFKWMGFLSFLLSVLMEAVRVVYIQLLLGKLNYNAMEARTHNILLLYHTSGTMSRPCP